MGSRGLKTVLWGTGSIFLSVGTLALGVAGGLVAGFYLFTSVPPPAPECPPQVECPTPEPCVCDGPDAEEVAPERQASTPDSPTSARPRPTKAPPAAEPEPSDAARVVVTGDVPRDLWFEADGRVVGKGPLAPGSYHLVAALGGSAPRVMGEVTVTEGQESVAINCSEQWGKCKAVE